MLAEYKEVDPRIFDEILEGARSQRQHRQQLEVAATNAAIDRQNNASTTQNYCAYGSIVIAALLVGLQITMGQPVGWIFPSILVLVGLGGRTVATLIAQSFASFARKD